MSFPSSPPVLPEEVFNEPPSSPLPPSVFPSSRKRHAGWDYDSSMSSDPIFSEDASEESEVTGYKRKKYVRGPWYQHSNASALSRVRGDTRKGDSGVWMGSDSSTDSIGSSGRRMQNLSFDEFLEKRTPVKVKQHQSPGKALDSPQARAAKLVWDAVEACRESVDLAQMNLGHLENETLKPLHQLIRVPVSIHDDQKITDDHFAPLVPKIQLFLARNDLETLPSELWNLGNIAVLSLRQNFLTQLPPSIGRLRNMHELNVAGNQLPYLPFELLELMRNNLVQCNLSPNPFVQPLPRSTSSMSNRVHSSVGMPSRLPSSADECLNQLRRFRSRYPRANEDIPSREALLNRLYATRFLYALQNTNPKTTYIASSATSFFEVDGSVVRSPFRSFSTPSEPDYTVSFARPEPPSSTRRSAAPSLFELSARACARSQYVGQLSSLLPEDISPPVENTIAKVIESREVGMQSCSVCSKKFLVARAQWMEYYCNGAGGEACSSSDMFLPFMRRACSWVCVDKLATEREEHRAECERRIAEYTSCDKLFFQGSP